MTRNPVKIRIQNFQSIQDLELEVDGFTCVTGKTNIGKSAIMRAISSSLLNSSIVNKVRAGASFSTVDISSGNWGFRWEKGGKGVNRYTIDGKVFDKTGVKQIQEISDMGFKSIKVGDEEIQPWWAPQFSPLFLLNKPGSQVTDFISEVSRLTVLQDAIVLSARGKKRYFDEARYKATELGKVKEKIARVSGFDSIQKVYSELEEQKKSIDNWESRIRQATDYFRLLEEHAGKIKNLRKVPDISIPEDNVGPSIHRLSEAHNFWVKLQSAAKKIIELRPIVQVKIPEFPEKEISEWNKVSKFSIIGPLKEQVKRLDLITTVKIPTDENIKENVDQLIHMFKLHGKLQRAKESVSRLDKDIHINDPGVSIEENIRMLKILHRVIGEYEKLDEIQNNVNSLNEEIFSLEEELSKIPSCPACNRPILDNHGHEVIP